VFNSFPLPLLVALFLGAAGVIWFAGRPLTRGTDALDKRLHLGQAFGGLILLAVATNLPEVAITTTAALSGQVSLAVGNLLGGIAIQTAVLAILDGFGVHDRPLSGRTGSLIPVLEAALLVGLLMLVIMGSQLPPNLALLGAGPGEAAIAVGWVAGLALLNKVRRNVPWQHKHGARADLDDDGLSGSDGQGDDKQGDDKQGDDKQGDDKQGDDKQGDDKQGGAEQPDPDTPSTGRAALLFGGGALATLVAGVVIEQSGDALAQHLGLSGAVFGATFLAAATALPEVSTGLAAVKMHDYQLAVSDIFGGNAFLPVLFLLAALLSGQPVLPHAGHTDLYLTTLGALLTTIYIWGLVYRPQRQYLRLGPDSILVLVFYILGIAGLFAVPQ
jgi:cation:H+ antiporter